MQNHKYTAQPLIDPSSPDPNHRYHINYTILTLIHHSNIDIHTRNEDILSKIAMKVTIRYIDQGLFI